VELAAPTSGRPALHDLRVHEVVQIQEGPLAPRRGLIHAIHARTVSLRVSGMFRRDVLVEVPIPFVASVDRRWLEEERRRAARRGDPYAYIEQQIEALQEQGLDHFTCADPETFDAQIVCNWIWFRGRCSLSSAVVEGLQAVFAVNVFAARVPILLIQREGLARVNQHRNENISTVDEFRARFARRHRGQVVNPATCYRGRRFQPQDFLRVGRTPLDNLAWYRFRRGHLPLGSVQFVAVPELGTAIVMTPSRKEKGKVRVVLQSMCYALPLLPLAAARLVRIAKWGVLSAQYHQLGRRVCTPTAWTPELTSQIEAVYGDNHASPGSG